MLLREDRADVWVLVIYTLVSGLLGLASPLAVQYLVNSVAASATQPLLVFSLLVLLVLGGAGALALMQLSLVEGILQRLFVRQALRIAGKLIRSTSRAMDGVYGPELANRFFDVLNIQKGLAKLLLDGLAAALQALIGLIILAFYDHSGLLFGFDLLLLLAVGFIIFPLGIGGLRSSIAESAAKYRVAGWLEELARCRSSFKLHAAPAFLLARAEQGVSSWLHERRRHFKVTYRQEAGSQVFQAVASAGVLAIGGYLVVQRELTLGQLVASQLIIAQVLKGTDKLLKQAETVYDLLTGLDKTGYLLDLEVEEEGHTIVPSSETGGARVSVRELRFAYPNQPDLLVDLNLELEPGERVSLVGASGVGKSTLAALLCNLEEPLFGLIEVNGVELNGVSKSSLREVVSVVGYDEAIFEGTIEENILMGCTPLTTQDVRWAVQLAQLTNDIARLPDGLQTHLVAGGGNLSRGQAQRVLLARAIVDRPELLILDEAFTGLDERTTMAILEGLFAPENPWTIIDISHEGPVVARADRIHVLAEGRIVESGSPLELAVNTNSEFAQLFPELSRLIVAKNGAL